MATITSHYKQVKNTQRVLKRDGIKVPENTAKSGDDDLKRETDLLFLREFDMEGKYGPCIGITRMERWERAEKFGLSPPSKVKDIIANHTGDEFLYSVWHKYDI